MDEATEAAVYRICPGGPGRWDVYRDPEGEHIASFGERSAALDYAMGLARGCVSWHLLFGSRATSARRGLGFAQGG